ncbi:MAG: 4Fe-4S dicluster domain-containing protein [Alphaproteobacteria bacterium]|nr:4Fe-4S dicluster domain-containing protein [Alphaproteobacteria bacterium]
MTETQEIETKYWKREVLIRLIKAFMSEDFAENTRLIPYDMRPKASEMSFRCCVYKERAILRSRTVAGLGFSIEEDDERTLLSEIAKKALKRERAEEIPLTVLQNACKGCPGARVYVTDLCQNCLAKACMKTCRFGAISVKKNRAFIDDEKCKKCGVCMAACPYGAIVKTIVPCEHACPVGAISKAEDGYAHIDMDKCISCGKCVSACPFGAVHAKSQIIDVLRKIKEGKNVVAMMAPAIVGHLPCTAEQMHTALKKIGFSKVYEVAQGADITTRVEAQDFAERMERGDGFMTTSCCAAYNELVKKHVPELKPFVSETKTPMYYTAELIKKEHPDAITVFLSPCFAKRKEAFDNPNINHILNFEELGAILIAMEIDVQDCTSEAFDYVSSKEGRAFALSGGVAKAVQAAWKGNPEDLRPTTINGLDKASIRDLKVYAKTGKCPLGNLIEVMSCSGGCIGGNAGLNTLKDAFKKVDDYSKSGETITK